MIWHSRQMYSYHHPSHSFILNLFFITIDRERRETKRGLIKGYIYIMHDPRPTLGSSASSGNTGSGHNHTLSMDDPLRRTKANHEPSEMAGIKDGIALSPEGEQNSHHTSSSRSHLSINECVRLDIKCPSLTGSSDSSILSVSKSSTIAQVKQIIERSWPGRPKASGMRFFKAGQTLSDEMIVDSIVKEEERQEPTPVHLVIRPDAWKQHFQESSKARSSQSIVSRTLIPAPLSFNKSEDVKTPTYTLPSIALPSSRSVHEKSAISHRNSHLASMVENMDPSQYGTFCALISWTYTRYVDIYEKEWCALYDRQDSQSEQTRQNGSELSKLATTIGCSIEEINLCIDQVERDVLLWDSVDESLAHEVVKSPFKYKNVTIDGLPYLLRIDQNIQTERLRLLHSRIKHLRLLYHQTEKLVNYQTIMERAVPTSANLATAVRVNATYPIGGAMVAPNQAQAIDRAIFRNRFVGLQREDWFGVLFSTAFLTFKIGLLVYVFTRGASSTKIKYMLGFASLYILFESYRLLMKRVQIRRRAIRRALGRDVANEGETNAADAGQNAGGQPNPPQSTTEGNGQPNEQEITVPLAPNRYTVSSPFLLEFWIERLAYWRLREEDRQMGLRTSNEQQRRDRHAHPDPMGKIIDVINDFLLMPIILFISTLIPEIEQRRRRAIDQRDELIRSTARKVEEQERRLREEEEEKKVKEDGKSNTQDQSTSSSKGANETLDPSNTTSVQIRQPALLRSRYAQRILDERRSQGRQIDIAQELEAAAREEGEGAMEQADMGFL